MIPPSLEMLIMILPLLRSLLDRIARNLGYATPEEVRQCVRSAEEEALRSLAHKNKERDATGPSEVSAETPRASGPLRYFVSYHFATDCGGNGFGCIEIERTHPVSAFEDIQKMGAVIQDALEGQNGQTGIKVCVLNWTPFEASLPGPGEKKHFQEEDNVDLLLVA